MRRRIALLLLLALTFQMAAPLRGQGADTEPPQIRVLEGGADLADNGLFNRAVQPVVQVTDASTVTVNATLNGAPFTSGTQVSAEGQYELLVVATDAAGNQASAAVRFGIDTTPPSFVSVLPVSGSLTPAAQVTLQGEVSGAAGLTIDGQPEPLVGGQFSAGPYTLAEGEKVWSLRLTDAAGNAATLAHRIVRDATAPVVAIGQPAAGAVRGASPVEVVGTVRDSHLSGVTVNGTAATIAGNTWVVPNAPLAEGENQITAEARDAAGNTAQAQRTVVLDTRPPTIAITDPAQGTVLPNGTISVSGTASDPHLDRVEVNGVRAQLTGGIWTASVPLQEGANDINARAFDTLGWSAADTVAVLRDSQAPAIHIDQPAEGSYLSAASVAVSGTVAEEQGLTVTVNGSAATLTGGAFAAPSVPLAEGENRLIARVVDRLGNQGAHTLLVYRDTVAPRLVSSDPASGALALPLDAEIDLTFSEELRAPLAAGAWRLETAAGQALAADTETHGEVLTVRPQAALPSRTQIRLVLTAGLVDRAGNALATPPTLAFTTADREAPPAPVLAAQPPAYVCAPRLALSGTAEPESVVQVTGGAGGSSARADLDGAFALTVDLRPETLNRLEVTAQDGDGNRSASRIVEVITDCTAPQAVSAALANGVFTVGFNERIDAATLAGALSVTASSGSVAGSSAAVAGGSAATFTPSAALPSGTLRLEVATTVRDLAGNPLAYPYSQIFGAGVTDSFLAGRVLDNESGRPLSGASVAVVSSNGAVNPEPQPEQTTGGDGRFRIPVGPGTHSLLIVRPGYTPVLRVATVAASAGTDVFDPRLTPAGSPSTIAPDGGAYSGPDGLLLEVPNGALAAVAGVVVTPLEEQGLPALLPYGWSPRGAAWVDLSGASLASAATLTLPVDAPDGTDLALVHLDLGTLQWHVVEIEAVADGKVSLPVQAEGGYAAVEADEGASAPPAPLAGTVLGSAAVPAGSAAATAELTFDPATILPTQRSLATVAYTLTGDPPSGLPLTLVIREELTLLNGTVRHEPPYEADVVLYRTSAGAARSRFGLRPSEQAQTVPLQVGAEDVTVNLYAGETVRGNVLGPTGGSVASDEGDQVSVPGGALPDPTAVSLDRRAQADLPLPVPAGTEFLGLLDLDLSGRELAAPASLTLDLGAAPASGQEGLLFQIVDLGSGPLYRPVAALAPTAAGWTTAAIDPQDLPWPGVRQGGLYLFARLTAGVGYLRGTVFDVDGSPLARAVISSPALPWIQLSNGGNPAGRYVLPAPVGSVTVTAENLGTANVGTAAASVPSADARVDFDLLLRVTGPRVLQTTPANGAANVPSGVEPSIRFSEPVDPATLAAGVLLYDGVNLVPVGVQAQGSLVSVRPRATLRPGAAHELRINTAVRDLQGHRLEEAVTVAFTTQASTANTQLDLSRVHLLEPVNGSARVLGRPGAVPAGTVIAVEKTTGTGVTVTGTAAPDGGFDLLVPATLADTLLLHVVLAGQNEIIVELTPFLTADGKAAYVPENRAATFTTLDGVTVEIEEGTFRDAALVRVAPRPIETVRAPIPADLPVVYAFQVDFGGVEAQKPLQITIPAPAGVSHDEFLLSKIETVLGQDYWMLYDLMRRTGGRITTELLPDEIGQASFVPQPAAVVASLATQIPSGPGGVRSIAAFARRGDGKNYLPGSANPGLYVVMENTTFLDFVAFPYVAGTFAYFLQTGLDGCIAAINGSIDRLLAYDAVLMPTRRGQRYTVVGRDLATGYKFFEHTFDPAPSGQITVLRPDFYGDRLAPAPVSGSPLRFYLTTLGADSKDEDLDRGIYMSYQRQADGSTLQITGDPGAAQKDVQLRLLGLDDNKNVAVRSAVNGSFTLSESVTAGNRYLLAIGAEIAVDDSLEIGFSEGLPDSFAGVEVLDRNGRNIHPDLDPVGSNETVRVRPPYGWRAGETYTLRLKADLADAAGNAWGHQLDLEFKIAASDILDTFELPAVRDVARLGSLLFVAAETQGLVILDASNPADLKNLIPGNITFPFPLNDAVMGVTVDPHGRVLVVGGGLTGFGQLKILDPLALDPAAIAANPDDAAVRYAAFKGSTIISDKLGTDSGTSLPEGRPHRVSVLSNDHKDRWRIGLDPAPAGVTLTPPASPESGGEYEVLVSGDNGTAGLPVTFRNLTGGRWHRVDANESGHYEIRLKVRKGDRVELLRNTQTLAYVATRGVGVEVVDVNAFYNEDPQGGPNTPESDVIGIYTGYDDPTLTLCNQPVSDIGSAMLDLDTLFEPGNAHPLTVVGLVGFRGLMLLESDPADVGELSFFNDACLNLDGSAFVTGLEVVQDYPFDFDEDGKLEESEERDYIVVTHRVAGVLIFDATDRDNLQLKGRVKLGGGQAAHVSVDRDRRRLYVSGYGGGLYVVDFDKVLTTQEVDFNQDDVDDRLIETIALPGNTNAPTFLLPELGIAFAGGLNRGLTSVAVGEPRLSAVIDNRDASGAEASVDRPRWRTVNRIAPMGVPTAPESKEPGAPDLPATFRVLAALPGVSGNEVRLDVVSLGSGGLPIIGAGDPAAIADLPRTALDGAEHGVRLRRLAQNPWEEGYQLYLSEEIAAVADLRAALHYQRTPAESTECKRCNRAELGIPEDAPEVLSGTQIAIRLPAALRTQLAAVYDRERMDAVELTLQSVPWDLSPTLLQEPDQNPSLGSGEVVPGTLLHSGEMTLTETDLSFKGRSIDFAFTRTYRSQTLGSGPLGPGWDYSYAMRLRELPNGDVDFFDGRGRRELFEKQPNQGFRSPAGRFVKLHRTSAGWVMFDPQNNLLRFDRFGRLISMADFVKDAPETGTEMQFSYDLASRLVQVAAHGRELLLAYDSEGRLSKLRDFTRREVRYEYDESGRLEKVTSPAVEIGETKFPDGLTTTYSYTEPTGDLAGRLSTRDNLATVTDPRSQQWLEITYSDADGDGRAQEVTRQKWGDSSYVSMTYQFGARRTEVVDRRANIWVYDHDEDGHPVRAEDPLDLAIAREYNASGVLTRETLKSGRQIVHQPRSDEPDPRSWGSLNYSKVIPDSRGPNGSSPELITSYTFAPSDPHNLPIRVVDPRSLSTRYTRERGLPVEIVEGGSEDQGTTRISYNEFGQPVRVINPNGHVTELEYYPSPPFTGFLRHVTVDPGGLNLKTQYEWDFWGNPAAVVDPQGVRHEFVYNELGWLVEEREGVASGGSVPLVRRYLYDRNGNVVEEQIASGDSGESFTRVQYDYGTLNEPLEVRREVTPGAGDFAVTQYGYDFNLNRNHERAPDGQVTQWTYDERNLVRSKRRGVDEAYEITETYEYDADGQLTSRTDGEGKVWRIAYDGYGRVAEEIDPLGNRRTTTYDSDGNITSVQQYDATGELLAIAEADYDTRNRPKAQRRQLWNPQEEEPEGAREVTRTFAYDPASNLRTVRDERGLEIHAEYDAAERQIAVQDAVGNRIDLTLDGQGNATRITDLQRLPDGGTATSETARGFNALGLLVQEVDPAGRTARWIRDVRGNVRLSMDGAGLVTEQVYDGLDRLLRTTLPDGSWTQNGYDLSSRLTSFQDALGQETRFVYDKLDRLLERQYPDGTVERFTYDKRDLRVGWERANGTRIEETYDDAGRLIRRQVAIPQGIEGPNSETFMLDGLGRVTQAASGSVVTQRRYDSLSRLLSESTGAYTVRYAYDDAGNRTEVRYPSGHRVDIAPDALGRPSTIDVLPGANLRSPKVAYGYRGADLVGRKVLGTTVSGTLRYDASGLLFQSFYSGSSGPPIVEELVTWNARRLKASQSRNDLNESGLQFTYDGAGRLTEARRIADTSASPLSRTLLNLPDRFGFTYDRAHNLLARSEERLCASDQVALPLDGSGRNRPGQVDGTPLAWSPTGNLQRKGDLLFHYDWKDRLTRVTRSDNSEVARYEYDAFDRRIAKVVDGDRIDTVWDGWQPIEDYKNLVLRSRRVYGLGIDEIVSLETDLDGDGTLTEYLPFYDETGNLVAVTDRLGERVIERYEYSPYGDRWTLVDSTPPRIEQVRVKGDEVWIELSEEVLLEPLREAVSAGSFKLEKISNGEALPIAVMQPVLTGRSAGRRLAVRLTLPPEDRPEPGTPLRLIVPAAALRDFFDNVATDGAVQSITWGAGDALLQDGVSPRVERVCVTGGRLEIELSEEPRMADVAAAIQLNGAPVEWTLAADGYTLVSVAALEPGTYALRVGTSPLDLAGLGLEAVFEKSFTLAAGETQKLVHLTPLPGLSSSSTVGNLFGFHGLPLDPETGLLYVRHRYYDPELGRFISTDPLGYTDGPNLYQYALNNPVNFSDPTGEIALVDNIVGGLVGVAVGWGMNCLIGECDYSLQDAAIDFGLGFITSGLSSIGSLRHLRHGTPGIARFAARGGLEIGLHAGGEYVRSTIRGEDTGLGQLASGSARNFLIGEAGGFAAGLLLRSRSAAQGVRAISEAGELAGSEADDVLIDAYGVLSRRSDIPGQAHHLNQAAAYRDIVKPSRGASIKLEGNIFQDAGAPHTRAHEVLEDFWNRYRGTDLVPTNLEYTRALQQSLRAAGLREAQVMRAVRAAIRERIRAGALGGMEVPRVPAPIRNLAR